MSERTITKTLLRQFAQYLLAEERCEGTVKKYLLDIGQFSAWLCGRTVTKETALRWKEHLLEKGLATSTVNSKLIALGGFLQFMGWEDCRVKTLKVQRQMFRDRSRELSRREYRCLIDTALHMGKERLALMMEAICATGIRVSEIKYMTVDAMQSGHAVVHLKGKVRTILLPVKLCRKLLKYAKKQKIASGEIFLTRSGKSVSRKQIWAEMKSLCEKAGIAYTKVFPHNLRHLFAQCFYQVCHDIAKLADVLGHSSIETTRIYLISSSAAHAKAMEQMHLV